MTSQLSVVARFRRSLASSSPRDIAPCFRRRPLLPSRQGFLLLRTLGNDHAALPGRLVRKPQLPSYLVCSDKEQNLTEMRREPQLAKPRDCHPSHTRTAGSVPLSLSFDSSGECDLGLMRKAQLGGGRNVTLTLHAPTLLPAPHGGTGHRGKGDQHKSRCPQALLEPADANLNLANCEFNFLCS